MANEPSLRDKLEQLVSEQTQLIYWNSFLYDSVDDPNVILAAIEDIETSLSLIRDKQEKRRTRWYGTSR